MENRLFPLCAFAWHADCFLTKANGGGAAFGRARSAPGTPPKAASNLRTFEPMAKYVFITGGVVSSLGKGVTSASLALLLKSRGYRVFMQKLDPYLNVDPGTMSGGGESPCASSAERIAALISSVTCGTTWTVPPR